jgi:hypothetical protein
MPLSFRIAGPGALTGLSCFAALLLRAPARAELPPWVYGQEQRQAPLRAEIQVLQVQLDPERQVRARLRLLAIQRQPLPARLRPGQTIVVTYTLPPARPQGWAGPSPLPLLRPGQRLPAWLAPEPQTAAPAAAAVSNGALFRPAAGGRSFGPSLEEARQAEP